MNRFPLLTIYIEKSAGLFESEDGPSIGQRIGAGAATIPVALAGSLATAPVAWGQERQTGIDKAIPDLREKIVNITKQKGVNPVLMTGSSSGFASPKMDYTIPDLKINLQSSKHQEMMPDWSQYKTLKEKIKAMEDFNAKVEGIPNLMDKYYVPEKLEQFKSQGAVFQPKNPSGALLAHELGHATKPTNPIAKLLQGIDSSQSFGRSKRTALGGLLGVGLGVSDNETLETLAPAVPAVAAAPMIGEELRAWHHGRKYLGEALKGQDQETINLAKKGLRSKFMRGMGSYALPTLGLMGAAALAPKALDYIGD